MSRIVSPLEGGPRTEELTDIDGNPMFEVQLKALTPSMAQFADTLGTLSCLCLSFLVISALLKMPDANLIQWGIFGGGALLSSSFFQGIWGAMLKNRVRMQFTSEHVSVYRLGEWKLYNRRYRHSFAIVEHDRAEGERRLHEYRRDCARVKGRALAQKPYYADSYIVCLELLGQRYDLIEVYGRRDALLICARLRACDEIIEANDRHGQGTALRPSDEWGSQTGDLPDRW